MKGPGDEEAKKEIAALELVEQHYTMEEERRLHAAALGPDYGEPVPMDMSSKNQILSHSFREKVRCYLDTILSPMPEGRHGQDCTDRR